MDLKPCSTVAEVARARELAQHYRWQARVRNPAAYGDKISVDHKLNLDPALMSDAQLAAIAAGGHVPLTIDGTCERSDRFDSPARAGINGAADTLDS